MALVIEADKKPTSMFDVLIIDDDLDILEIIKSLCLQLNYFRNVVTSKDGADAMAKLSNQKFRLIILDLKLPKRSGVDLLKQMKLTSNRLENIMVVSGMVGPAETQVLLKSGIRHIMVKPFKDEDFLNKIKTIIELP